MALFSKIHVSYSFCVKHALIFTSRARETLHVSLETELSICHEHSKIASEEEASEKLPKTIMMTLQAFLWRCTLHIRAFFLSFLARDVL